MRRFVLPAVLAAGAALVLAASAPAGEGNPADVIRDQHLNRLTGQIVPPSAAFLAGLPGTASAPARRAGRTSTAARSARLDAASSTRTSAATTRSRRTTSSRSR